MRRFLLAICLFMAAGSVTFAQTSTIPTVSRTDYTTKVSTLNTQLTAHRTTDANVTWDQIHEMIKNEFAIMKSQYRAAVVASNEPEKTRLMGIVRAQQDTYAEIMRLHVDMDANRAAMNTKLTEFGSRLF